MRSFLLFSLLAGCQHRGHQPLEDDDDDSRIEQAECCMGAKVWEASEAGWGSPKTKSWILREGETEKMALSMIRGLTYRFEACGHDEVEELDLFLYDRDTTLLISDDTDGREPMFTWTAPSSGTRYLVVRLTKTKQGVPGAVSQYTLTYSDD